jgi:glycosyltransferase involved in cell wall biosynthesis
VDKILLSHAGRQHSYKVALAMQELGCLGKFITSGYYKPSQYPDRFIDKDRKLQSFLRKRNEPDLSDENVIRFPWLEAPELIARFLFGSNRAGSDVVCLRDAIFDNIVAKNFTGKCKNFWGFQGSCLNSLKSAKSKGAIAIAEFATAHVNSAIRILQAEKKKNPEWADSISNLYFPDWYLSRLKEEPFAADYCVVASSFSRKSLENEGVGSEKIIDLPLGADLKRFWFKVRVKKDYFQILFVGGVGQRKGIKYLLDAVKKISSDRIKLKIIGPVMGSGKAFKSYSTYYDYLGKLDQDEIVRVMHESDCLVLPSLFEGFGLVIPEAMATGIPVIASTRTAAPEIIRQGVDGFVLEPEDVDGLVEKIEWLASNKEKAVEMGKNAAERANEFSWSAYKDRLKSVIERIK